MTDPTFEFDDVFDPSLYLHFYEKHLSADRTAHDVSFVADALDLSPGDEVLDVPCGHGRVSNALTERGHDVTGLDRSAGFLARARDDAETRGVAVDYHRGDMRSLPFADDSFDAAYNLFTSFGYFDDGGNRRVLDEVARVLRPGGRFLVETLSHDGVLRDFHPRTTQHRDDDLLVDEHEYDPRTGRIETTRTTFVDGERQEATFSVRLYTYPELAARFADAGFDVVDDAGERPADLPGEREPFTMDSTAIVLVGELA